MKTSTKAKSGHQLLIEKYRNLFLSPENINYYSKRDLKVAERKFLKYAIMNGEFQKIA